MLHAIASAFIGAVAFISSLFGIAPQTPVQDLGASLPSATAVFETSLQSRISSTDTSLTLVANSVRGGSSLSGFQCFTVDEGRTDAEYLCGTVSGTGVTSMTRGIDPSTGTTSNSALKFAHRVGADVKITDFPVLQILRNQANGADTYPNVLHYASGVTPIATGDLTDKEYVDSLAFNGAGVIDASSIAKGVVELATAAEAAASTPTGTSGNLVLPASLASSTFNQATAASVIPVTNSLGHIDAGFVSSSTQFSSTGFTDLQATSSVYIGDFPAWQIGKQVRVFSSTGTSTFSVPSGISKVSVEVVGGGNDGGTGAGNNGGGGGGGGGCAFEQVDVTGTTTIQVYVGDKGLWSTFGTNGFYLSATPGTAGSGITPGVGGLGVGADINLPGGAAAPGMPLDGHGGDGGSSCLGFGGHGPATGAGNPGTNYGGGGSGGGDNTGAGAVGAQGIVIVRW